jgi:3-(3-hydroxy-phenyl)propionate hydroxylase
LFVQPKIHRDARADAPESEARLDDLLQPRFLIASATPEVQGWLSPESRALWRRLGGERIVIGPLGQTRLWERLADDDIQYFAETDALFAAWMSQLDSAAVVVRPDRYVFGTARDAAQLNRLIASVGRHVIVP